MIMHGVTIGWIAHQIHVGHAWYDTLLLGNASRASSGLAELWRGLTATWAGVARDVLDLEQAVLVCAQLVLLGVAHVLQVTLVDDGTTDAWVPPLHAVVDCQEIPLRRLRLWSLSNLLWLFKLTWR